MDFLIGIWDTVVPFLFVLTVLVFVHELGHYLVARWVGVRVEVFSIGFGPEIFGWYDRVGTRWKVSWIPLGGYVKMFGEADFIEDEDGNERPLTDAEKDESFQHKRLGQRTAVVAAGPAANFVFAIVIYLALFLGAGLPNPLSSIGSVAPDSAAEEAGFASGDSILSINGEAIKWFADLQRIVSANPNTDLVFVVQRDDAQMVIHARPRSYKGADESYLGRGFLGVRPHPEQFEYESVGLGDALVMSVEQPVVLTGRILDGLWEIISGVRGTDELGGPIRIAVMSGEVAQGGWIQLLSFLAAFSVNLCLINLFPIPMLDGGHLVFYAIEGVRGRPLGATAQEYGFRFGLALVLALMVFATWNDLSQLHVFDFIKSLIS